MAAFHIPRGLQSSSTLQLSRTLHTTGVKQMSASSPMHVRSPRLLLRTYATHSSLGSTSGTTSKTTRKAITPISDDGRYRWDELSTGEKAARTTQQTVNLFVVCLGVVMTAGVSYFLYTELFSSDSKTRQFNHAVDRVKSDPRCTELLGSARKIKAFGEPTWNKWARARPIAHTYETDRMGTVHLRMHFNVEGPLNAGVVNLHMTKKPSESEFEYRILALDVKGHEPIYLENADDKGPKKGGVKMFGVQWR